MKTLSHAVFERRKLDKENSIIQYAYCGRCRMEYEDDYVHYSMMLCPNCQENMVVRHMTKSELERCKDPLTGVFK